MKFNERPKNWDAYVGQKSMLKNLKIYVEVAKAKNIALDHILFAGASGMGKTSLAFLVSYELNKRFHYLNGPHLQKQSDLISILSSIQQNEILFIDEIHAVPKEILEILYPVLEGDGLSIVVGKDYNSKIVKVPLPDFTLIGATTELEQLELPFFNRFSIFCQFQSYELEEIKTLLINKIKETKLKINDESINEIASYSRQNPRTALNLYKRFLDFAFIKKETNYDLKMTKEILQSMQLYPLGLTWLDYRYLTLLFEQGPLGLNSLSQLLNLPPQQITQLIEPLLLQHCFISRTTRGRIITTKGQEYYQKNKNVNSKR